MMHTKKFYILLLTLKSLRFQKIHHFFFVSTFYLIGLPACSQNKNKEADFLAKYGGDPYMGGVKVEIYLPDSSKAKTDYGEASAYFKELIKGTAQMVVFGAINNKKGDAGFTADGPVKGASWQSEGGKVSIEIKPDGTINGGGQINTQSFSFTGSATAGQLKLVTRVVEKEKTKGGLPAGSTLVFTYTLTRSTAQASTKTTQKCKKIVWVSQYIGHFDGSGSTIRVPKCMD